MDTQEMLKRFEPSKDVKTITAEPQVRSARFSSCGKVLIAGGFDARVRRWVTESDVPVELPSLDGHHG